MAPGAALAHSLARHTSPCAQSAFDSQAGAASSSGSAAFFLSLHAPIAETDARDTARVSDAKNRMRVAYQTLCSSVLVHLCVRQVGWRRALFALGNIKGKVPIGQLSLTDNAAGTASVVVDDIDRAL